MGNLDKFFNPKSIAIVGASPKKEKLGNVLMRNILEGGWKGKLYLVNPKYTGIGPNKYYAKLSEIKKPVDLILIAIPASAVNQIVKEGAEAKPKIDNYIVISSGFKEAGKEGWKFEKELKSMAEKNKLNILGPNCLGFINPFQKLNATFTSSKLQPGKVSIVSQSGALVVALLDWAENMSVGFSKMVSIGNKAVLDECDIIEFLAEDKNTRAIALYLEDIIDGQKFIKAVERAANKKPIIILKAGKNQTGQKAVSSHTGSLAQDEAIIEAVFKKLNIIEAKTVKELQNFILYLNSGRIPIKKEIIILTNAGGPGVLASDFIGKSKYLKLLKIPNQTKNQIKKYLSASASVENPIDIIGDAVPKRYEDTLKIISRKFSWNTVLVILTPQTQTNPKKVAKILKKYEKKLSVLTTCFMGGAKVREAIEYLRKSGIANFENPEEALSVIEKLAAHDFRKNKRIAAVSQKEIHLKLEINSLIQSAVEEERKVLFWNEAEKVFGSYGIKLAKSIAFKNIFEIESKKIPYPCVLKTDDPKIIHRWDKKAVTLNIKSEKELKIAWEKMKKATQVDKFLIQPMARAGLELIIGLKRDKVFGSVILIGWGGTFTEIFADRIILIPLLTADEIKNKLEELKIFPVLRGFRGEKGYNIDEIINLVLALQEMFSENLAISQIDINPVMFYNDGSRYQVLDAKIYLKN